MEKAKTGFIAQMKSFPKTFYVANTMEIFERMAWYGFFALSSLYITGPKETGALGFTSEQRGQLQAIATFFLYIFPVATGALADRYGYRKMFTIAYIGMIISYYLLGQFTTFPMFLLAFMMVAVSAAIFKPVVVSTVARVTTAENSGIGFGIFYMMVNIGGFVGPLVAGAIRGASWKYIFIASSCWAAVNLIIVLIFYKDPSTEATSTQKRTLGKVARDMTEVLGNVRFGLCCFVVLIALMLANQGFSWFTWDYCYIFVPVWLVLNFAWDAILPKHSGDPNHAASHGRAFFVKRMHCSNWRFALFLLIMSGFWTSFNQIFQTMPEYLRDYTDTAPMVNAGRKMFTAVGRPEWINKLAAIEEPELMAEVDRLYRKAKGAASMVPPPVEKELDEAGWRKKVNGAADDLRDLAKHRGLDPKIRDEAKAQAAKLTGVDASQREVVKKELAAADEIMDRGHVFLIEKEYREDPSLTDDDHAKIQQQLARLNAPSAPSPLTPAELTEGARKILAYKVRITPLELAELLNKVPSDAGQPEDALVESAIETINKRLGVKALPTFSGDESGMLRTALRDVAAKNGTLVPRDVVVAAAEKLNTEKRPVEPALLALGVREIKYRPTIWARMDAGRQVNSEHIVNFDSLAIVLLQVLISFLMGKFHQFTTMIVGMVVAAVGIGLSMFAGGTMVGPIGGLFSVAALGIVIFAVGEMMSSPTSQEYVGRIAPKERVAVYMGYYFVAVALGNLFGSILSGELYGSLARDMKRPDLMWLIFGVIMLATAAIFLLYNKFALPKSGAHGMAKA